MRSLLLLPLLAASLLQAETGLEHRVLATSKTSTMEREMNAAAGEGFRFTALMGGETSVGGKEVVIVMSKDAAHMPAQNHVYKLLATQKTSTMEKELRQLGAEGYRYMGQTVFESAFGGKEVVVILERQPASAAAIDYVVVATKRTGTLQKELAQAAARGYMVQGLSVGQTSFGGAEVVCILARQ